MVSKVDARCLIPLSTVSCLSRSDRGLWDLVWPSSSDEEMITDDDWQRISVDVHADGTEDFEIVFQGVTGQ